MSTKFYLTTAIYYANAAPHIGHAYEIIAADVIARFQRLAGKQVFFLTGTDEHGVKVQKTAETLGLSPQAYVDKIADTFKTEWGQLNITEDRFIRTTEPSHYEAVAKMWNKLLAKGDIYKASYEADYCRGCEVFLNDRDKDEEGKCLIHKTLPEKVSEENYFFKLSAYKEKLQALLKENEQFIVPASRKQEVINILEDIQDISVSRARTSVSWGIPVPNDPDQVIYVWIDALSNYLTGVEWQNETMPFATFWPPDVQVIGKDILRFHAIYWPAMLMSAELPLPKTLLVHGFINIADTKLSKSSGTLVTVNDLMTRFELKTVDPIRYYLMMTTGFGQDGNYTDDDFKLKINADLANNLGNLLNRSLAMLQKYCDGIVPEPAGLISPLIQPETFGTIYADYEQYRFNDALVKILGIVDAANKLINDEAPWTLAKEEKTERLHDVLYRVLNALRAVAALISPVTPELAQNMWEQLGFENDITIANWQQIVETVLPVGQKTVPGQPILPRLESDLVGADKKK